MDWMLINARKSEFWREGRKLLDRSLGPSATMSYRQMIQENTHRFLSRLLATPKDFRDHARLLAVALLYIILPLTAMQLSRESCDVPHIWL
jgi:cytochrome P450